MNKCRWCNMMHGPTCFLVKAIEFFEDGVTVKRVEFKTAADYPQQIVSIPTTFVHPTAKVDAAAGSHSTYFDGT